VAGLRNAISREKTEEETRVSRQQRGPASWRGFAMHHHCKGKLLLVDLGLLITRSSAA
jgi:hypothetical protein